MIPPNVPSVMKDDNRSWENLTWVLTAMHHPREIELLTLVQSGNYAFLTNRDVFQADAEEAAKNGVVAGNVLSVLYALDQSPWKILEPGLDKAIHVVKEFAFRESFADGSKMPRGQTAIRKCYDAMRPVAHIWAAVRLHREYPMMPHDDLLRTDGGVDALLRIARAVQLWALEWKPARSTSHVSLLGAHPWIVPDKFSPTPPPWSHKPEWLLKTLDAYKARARN